MKTVVLAHRRLVPMKEKSIVEIEIRNEIKKSTAQESIPNQVINLGNGWFSYSPERSIRSLYE